MWKLRGMLRFATCLWTCFVNVSSDVGNMRIDILGSTHFEKFAAPGDHSGHVFHRHSSSYFISKFAMGTFNSHSGMYSFRDI